MRHRFRFEKTGATALLGHLDVVRELPRILRRVGVAMAHTGGFHPKPEMTFAPALPLGVMSLDEYVDLSLDAEVSASELDALLDRMNRAAPSGLRFLGCCSLSKADPSIARVVGAARYAVVYARSVLPGPDPEAFLEARCRALLEARSLPVQRRIKGVAKRIELRDYLGRAALASTATREALARAGLCGELVAAVVEVAIRPTGAVKPAEIAGALAAEADGTALPHRAVRLELLGLSADGPFSPFDLERARAVVAKGPPAAEADAPAIEPSLETPPEPSDAVVG